MSDCQKLEPLFTPYVDDEADTGDRAAIEAHLRVCPRCHGYVAAERAVRALLKARQPNLADECAPDRLRARCRQSQLPGHKSQVTSRESQVRRESQVSSGQSSAAGRESPVAFRRSPVAGRPLGAASPVRSWRARVMPFGLAASLVLVVGGAFTYEATSRSSRVMAAELTADHIKCFGVNRVLGSVGAPIGPRTASAARGYLASSFGWDAQLPDINDLRLESARPCLYGEGRMAHVMYHYGGHPVSLFMLPGTTRRDELIDVMGHEAAIWSAGGRTFVLIADESRAEVERLAATVRDNLK